MSTINRIMQIKTTIIGIIILVVAIYGFIKKWLDYEAFGALCLLSYTYINAKDSLLEGITLNMWKKK